MAHLLAKTPIKSINKYIANTPTGDESAQDMDKVLRRKEEFKVGLHFRVW